MPVASSFSICARSTGRCRITRPERKSQVLSGPTAFSHTYACAVSNTRDLHFGQGPSGTSPEKSGASVASSFAPSPKSKPTSLASFKRIDAENGLPSRLRKPSSGPSCRSRSKRVGFGDVELPPAHDLPEAERAGLALELLVVLVHFAAAFRAARGQRAEIAGDRVALVALGLADDVLRHGDDLAHERVALQLAVLHLRELELPLRRELRREELGHAEAVEQRHQRERLRGGHELAAFAVDVPLGDQAFDDLRARRRRAEALLAHRFAQLLVVDQLARAFHRREQRRFVRAAPAAAWCSRRLRLSRSRRSRPA